MDNPDNFEYCYKCKDIKNLDGFDWYHPCALCDDCYCESCSIHNKSCCDIATIGTNRFCCITEHKFLCDNCKREVVIEYLKTK